MQSSTRRAVDTTNAPKPAFSYSQGIVAGGLPFIAGQVPRHPVTGDVSNSFADQVRQTLDNLAAVATAAGTTLANAARVNVYLEDLDSIRELDVIYREYFVAPFPARTTVQTGLRGYMIEVDAVVVCE